MKIRVDIERCQGHGLCEAAAPGMFEFDDGGYNVSPSVDVGPEQEAQAQAQAAAATCPEQAIALG